MKNIFKKLIIGTIALLPAITMTFAFNNSKVFANQSTMQQGKEVVNYQQTLSKESDIFYSSLKDMENFSFLEGTNYIVENAEIVALAKKFAKGNNQINEMFEKAKYAYRLDTSSNIFVDYDKLCVNAYIKDNQTYVSIGAKAGENFYLNTDFDTMEEIETANKQFNNSLTILINNALSELSDNASTYEKVHSISRVIKQNTDFDYCNSVGDENKKDLISTAYGALINKKAISEGYAKLFNLCMQKLDIPCINVNGLVYNGYGYEPHMWNYVQIEDEWHGVDIALNDMLNLTNDSYILATSEQMQANHYADQINVAEGKDFLPDLKSKKIIQNNGTLNINTVLNSGKTEATISYKGMGINALKSEGISIAVLKNNQFTSLEYLLYATETVEDFDNYVKITLDYEDLNLSSTEFAVFGGFAKQGFPIMAEEGEVYPFYSQQQQENIIIDSGVLTQISHDTTFKQYPYVEVLYPDNTFTKFPIIFSEKNYFEITFNEKLKLIDDELPANVTYQAKSLVNQSLTTSDLDGFARFTDIEWDGDKTIKFNFEPSKLLKHNLICYEFKVENLIGETSELVPNTISALFKFDELNFTKFNEFQANSVRLGQIDFINYNWQYKDINNVNTTLRENQTNQIVLNQFKVESEREMVSAVESIVTKNALFAYDVYDLELTACGGDLIIPTNAKVNLLFKYPAGFNNKYSSITYMVYGFERNADGSLDLESVSPYDLVATEEGLWLQTNQMGGFVVVALDSTQFVKNNKGINLNIQNKGGSIQAKIVENAIETIAEGNINFLTENQSIKYIFTEEEGYEIEYVLLNGINQEITDNEIILNYDVLKVNNILDISYIKTTLKQSNQQQGITLLNKSYLSAHRNLITIFFDSFSDIGVEEQVVVIGDKIQKPENPTKESYKFLGWFNGNKKWDFDNDTATEDMTLQAHWKYINKPLIIILSVSAILVLAVVICVLNFKSISKTKNKLRFR